MTEKINVGGNDIWVKIDPHFVIDDEFFTVTYYSVKPETLKAIHS